MPTSPATAASGSERTPLLSTSPTPETQPKKKPWLFYCLLIFILFVIVDVGAFLVEPPRTRLAEAKLCVSYYRTHDPSKINSDGTVDEQLCKENAIQQRMARIFGWQDMFDSIPGILLAIPYGSLADSWGRKWVFTATLIGVQLHSAWILFICYMPGLALELTWLSSFFYIIGGGPVVMSAIGIMMVADVVPPEKRTAVFLYATASVIFAGFIAPILAARLMENGSLLPYLTALAIQQFGITISFFFPETKHLRDLPEPKDAAPHHVEPESEPPETKNEHGYRTQLRQFKDALSFIGRDTVLTLVILTFLPNRMGRQSILLLIRYASKRYHWPIKNAAYIVSIQSATNLVGLTIFVPLANYFMLKYLRLPAHHADLWLSRGSILITTIGFLVMGMASYPALLIVGISIFNLGTGFDAAMRSTAVHLVGGQSSSDLGKLFALIAIVEGVGGMIAGPFLAGLFEWGIRMGEPWIGMPYFASAGLVAGITVVTFLISVRGVGGEGRCGASCDVDDDDEI